MNPARSLVAQNLIKWMDGDPYLLASAIIPSDNGKIKKLVQQITQGKTTDVEKSQAIFKWVSTHIQYDDGQILEHPFMNQYPTVMQILATRRSMWGMHDSKCHPPSRSWN